MDNQKRERIWKVFLVLSFVSIASFFIFSSLVSVFDVVGQATYNNSNTTYIAQFTVGNAAPIVDNVSVNAQGIVNITSIDLVPGGNQTVNCTGIVNEPNGDGDILNASATLFNQGDGFLVDGVFDNNYRYYSNCSLDLSFGNADEAYASCYFNITYYAFNNSWNCTIFARDLNGLQGRGSDDVLFNEVVAINVTPAVVDYGTVNITQISAENFSNWTNIGNINITLSLQGWAAETGGYSMTDGNAMNCSGGLVKNISVIYHRYNFSKSWIETSDDLNLTLPEFNLNYTAIPNTDSDIGLNITHRLTDDHGREAMNETFWRIYAPSGVAGNCSGFVQVTASFTEIA